MHFLPYESTFFFSDLILKGLVHICICVLLSSFYVKVLYTYRFALWHNKRYKNN